MYELLASTDGNPETFKAEFIVAFQTHIRRAFRHRSRERFDALGNSSAPEEHSYLKERYDFIISKLSETPIDSYVLRSIIENRLVDKIYTIKQISLFYRIPEARVARLEKGLVEELRKLKEEEYNDE